MKLQLSIYFVTKKISFDVITKIFALNFKCGLTGRGDVLECRKMRNTIDVKYDY